eukprot:TRINITY_DN31360_c0_g1_i1.p1 TRINITY_DN31360_c0_g1~~TRINITY_DN31360_c0_g1_i1.p1  ORF type:complete len:793 (+),score=162.47 TRINITY_DN31360_c0_g1_i1:318-2381(+)
MHTGKTLQLARPGKSPIVINVGSPEEMASFAALVQSQRMSKRPGHGLKDVPPVPGLSPAVGPPSTGSRMGRSSENSSEAEVEAGHGGDISEATMARIASRASSVASEWSAQVPEELAQPSKDGTQMASQLLSAGGSSSSTAPCRQSQAETIKKVVQGLGPKLAYRKAMEMMWNYDLEAARVLLEPWKSSVLWHAGAIAECSVLRTVLTGKKSEALATLEDIKAAEAIKDSSQKSTVAHEVFTAEMLLLRSGLQVMLGARLRALYNLRQCWCTYHRLETLLENDGDLKVCVQDDDIVFTYEDLRGRILFGLGLFYMAASLVPASLVPLIRLAGFIMHRQRGKTYLWECVERELGPRSSMAAILLSMYHLDLEPDMKHAANILVVSLSRQPENVLLHWAGSVLAWRNTFISQAVNITGKALWSCGQELGEKAVYLRYELGMFHFIGMEWDRAHDHLLCVYESVHSEKVFFPYRTLVTTQLAAVAFSMGQHDRGEILCKECGAVQDWSGLLKIENDFAKIMQIFLKKRKRGRDMLAFEVMYLLRQFPKVPQPMLIAIQNRVKKIMRPFGEEAENMTGAGDSEETELALVEQGSALTIQVVICFYLGDADAAMVLVPDLSQVCPRLPAWASYISAHGLYWCGRVLALNERNLDAQRCLQQAKAYKKYPFNINVKISKVLAEHEELMTRTRS